MKAKTLLLSLSAIAVILAGCQQDNNTDIDNGTPGDNITKVDATIITEAPGTRTIMEGTEGGGFNTNWSTTPETIGVYTYSEQVVNDGNESTTLTYNAAFTSGTVSAGATPFSGQLTYNSAYDGYPFNVYAYYPHSATAGNDPGSVALSFPTEQTMPANGTFDPAADIMVSRPGKQMTIGAANNSIDDFYFRHMGTFININVNGITNDAVSGTEIVEKVVFSSTAGVAGSPNKILSGNFTVDLASGQFMFVTDQSSAQVTLNVPAGVQLSELNAWIVANPFSIAVGQDAHRTDKLLIQIYTANNYISKTIVSPAGGLEFAQGGAQVLKINIDANTTVVPRTGKAWDFSDVSEWSNANGDNPAAEVAQNELQLTLNANSETNINNFQTLPLYGAGTYTWDIVIPQMEAGARFATGGMLYAEGTPFPYGVGMTVMYGTTGNRTDYSIPAGSLMLRMYTDSWPVIDRYMSITPGAYTFKIDLVVNPVNNFYTAVWSLNGAEVLRRDLYFGPADSYLAVVCTTSKLQWWGDNNMTQPNTGRFTSVSYTPAAN